MGSGTDLEKLQELYDYAETLPRSLHFATCSRAGGFLSRFCRKKLGFIRPRSGYTRTTDVETGKEYIPPIIYRQWEVWFLNQCRTREQTLISVKKVERILLQMIEIQTENENGTKNRRTEVPF